MVTRDEILNMPAGQETDDLISLYVLGEDITPRGYAIPPYSTNIAAAWEVVGKYYSMTLEKFSDGEEWRCYLVTEREGKNHDVIGGGETAPLAICRAALISSMF